MENSESQRGIQQKITNISHPLGTLQEVFSIKYCQKRPRWQRTKTMKQNKLNAQLLSQCNLVQRGEREKRNNAELLTTYIMLGINDRLFKK